MSAVVTLSVAVARMRRVEEDRPAEDPSRSTTSSTDSNTPRPRSVALPTSRAGLRSTAMPSCSSYARRVSPRRRSRLSKLLLRVLPSFSCPTSVTFNSTSAPLSIHPPWFSPCMSVKLLLLLSTISWLVLISTNFNR